MPSSTELRKQITAAIVDALEAGNIPPWRKPWKSDPNAGLPTNAISKRRYSGINVLLLEAASMQHRFESKHWATYRQWAEIGGQVQRRPADVKPGHWGTSIVFYKPITKTRTDDTGDEVEDKFCVMKSFTVFNVDQVEGCDHLRASNQSVAQVISDLTFAEADEAIKATNAEIRHGGSQAFYNLKNDFIQIPPRSSFVLPEYYETLCHELVHWTEPSHRLAWDRKGEGYAMGELIAEIGGCFLCSELGVPVASNLTNHVSYLRRWLDAMRGDPKFIFQASTQASKAADYLLSFSRREADQPEPLIVV